MKQKAAITERPRARKSRMLRRLRAIPASFRREVWKRDHGRCTFVGEDGHRCCATRGLEFAHLKPWGKGGEHSVENITLRCRAHNAFEADRDYGTSFMATKRQRKAPEKCLSVREPAARYIRLQRTPATTGLYISSRLAAATCDPGPKLQQGYLDR